MSRAANNTMRSDATTTIDQFLHTINADININLHTPINTLLFDISARDKAILKHISFELHREAAKC